MAEEGQARVTSGDSFLMEGLFPATTVDPPQGQEGGGPSCGQVPRPHFPSPSPTPLLPVGLSPVVGTPPGGPGASALAAPPSSRAVCEGRGAGPRGSNGSGDIVRQPVSGRGGCRELCCCSGMFRVPSSREQRRPFPPTPRPPFLPRLPSLPHLPSHPANDSVIPKRPLVRLQHGLSSPHP